MRRTTFGAVKMADQSSLVRMQLEKRKLELELTLLETKDELAKVEFALAHFAIAGNVNVPTTRPLAMTAGGTVRHLSQRIVELLREKGHVLTISDMAKAWFQVHMPLTPDQLRRRLSVTTSAMYRSALRDRRPPPIVPSGILSANREIHWALPQWMVDGKLEEVRRQLAAH